MTSPNPTPYILWGAMGSAQAMFLFVGTRIEASGAASWAQLLVLPAIVCSLLSIVLNFVPAFQVVPQPTRSIIRWATAEVAAILGLIAYLQSGEHLFQYGCAAFGFLAWAYAFPTDAATWPPPQARR